MRRKKGGKESRSRLDVAASSTYRLAWLSAIGKASRELEDNAPEVLVRRRVEMGTRVGMPSW